MAITYRKTRAEFAGEIGVEDAETLLAWLRTHPKAKVDLSACSHLHAATLQALMASRVRVTHWPEDPTLETWLKAALA